MIVGDKLRISKDCGTSIYFAKGDIAVILAIGERGVFLDFNNQGNKFIYDDGQWFCNYDDIEVIQ